MAYAALANGGTLYVPQVVERIDSHDGRPLVTYGPTVTREIEMPPAALDVWRRGMVRVTNEPGGTAFDHGHVAAVQVMGKTGTAEIRSKRRKKEDDERDIDGYQPTRSHAWFAGIVPADDPELVIVVLVEHGGSGGRIAWPIAKQIIEAWAARAGRAAPLAGHASETPPRAPGAAPAGAGRGAGSAAGAAGAERAP
jgi:penicillin-binding protein 2